MKNLIEVITSPTLTHHKGALLLILFLSLLAVSCLDSVPETPTIVPARVCTLSPGESIPLQVSGVSGNATFEWNASAGLVTPQQGPTVTYSAPDSPGQVTIIVEAKKGTNMSRGSITCNVEVTPTPTPTITETPTPLTPTVTPTPTITDTSLPTSTDTPTPPPCPLMEIFPQVWSCEASFVFKNEGGILDDSFEPSGSCVHSGVFGLQLTYSNSGPANAGWGVQWVGSPDSHFDASEYSIFRFWVRGESGGETFQIGIKDTSGREEKIESSLLTVVGEQWTPISVELSEYEDDVSLDSIENVNLGFNESHGSGTICVDDIEFAP